MTNEPRPSTSDAPSTTPPGKLKGWLPMSLGVLAIVIGGVWTLQGLGIVAGSAMSDVKIWAVIGPIVAIAGLFMIVTGVRARTRAKRPQA